MRERYESLIANPAELDRLLLAGADKARRLATPFIRELRHAVGLRPLAVASAARAKADKDKPALASFKQYRERDGLFYFKLVSPEGQLLLQSTGFASPREAGQLIGQLQQGHALATVLDKLAPLTSEQLSQAEQALAKMAAED